MSAGRPWTDEEIGFLQDREDWSAKQVAEELGRTPKAVSDARRKVQQGRLGAQKRFPWTPDEDAALLSAGSSVSAGDLTSVLPGRSPQNIRARRRFLGIEASTQMGRRPFDVGPRPLVAKTCLTCGRVLTGSWFTFNKAANGWSQNCRQCASEKASASRRELDPATVRAQRIAQKAHYQRLTAERAERAGEPYVGDDIQVLANQDLTDLQKAFRLRRSYCAVAAARRRYGFKSKPDGLGDPERDVWVIDNPNLEGLAS